MTRQAKTTTSGKKTLQRAVLVNFVIFSLSIVLSPPHTFSYVQAQEKVRSLQSEFILEPGCPINVSGVRTELDLDPFNAPFDARIYIDYVNNSDRPVGAVKFRVRFCDAQGNDRGTFHAPDIALSMPGGTHSQKWKYEKVDPRTASVKIRALQVKFQDGTSWQSAKMQELAIPPGQELQVPAGQSSPDSGADAGSQSDKAPGASP